MRQLLKNIVWSAASRTGLYGMYTGRFEDHWVRVQSMDIFLPDLGKTFDGVRIAHLSDLHCSPIVRSRHLAQYIELTNRLEPDYVMLTGDFITASYKIFVRKIRALLKELAPRTASFAVLGNHDYGLWHPTVSKGIPALGEYLAGQLDAAGIQPLISESVTLRNNGDELQLVGLGELWSSTYDPEAAFAGVDRSKPVLALVHNPDAAPELASMGADYVLSGHTHGKEVPDNLLNNLLFPVEHRHFVFGQYRLAKDQYLYVNRGVGNARLHKGHRPEIVMFTLRRAPHPATRPHRVSRPANREAVFGRMQEAALAFDRPQGPFCPWPQQ